MARRPTLSLAIRRERPLPPPRPYSPFSLAIRRKAPHFQPSHTLQDASLSALPYVAGRPTLPAWPVVITRRVAACEKEATRPPTIVRGTFATRERCTMRARQASARTNDGAVSSLLANYSVGVKSQTLPFDLTILVHTYAKFPPPHGAPSSRDPRLTAPSPYGTLASRH